MKDSGLGQFLKSTRGVLVIAVSSFVVLVALLSTAIYFLSAGRAPIKTGADAPVMAFWEVMKFAFDPEKMRHISRSEGAFFRAEEANRKHQYQLAHDNYEEACHEILLGAGEQSMLAATFLERQADFENDSGKYNLAIPICRQVLKMMPYCNDRVLLLRTRQQLVRALVFGTKAERAEAVGLCLESLPLAQAVDKDNGSAGYNTETSSVLEWLAYSQRQADRLDDAISTYKKTIALYQLHGPDYKDATAQKKISDVYIQMANVEIQRNDFKAAIADYDAGLAQDAKAYRLLRLRCAARIQTHDYDGAIADTVAADHIKHNDVVETDELLTIYQAKGDARAALDTLAGVLKKGGPDESCFLALRAFVLADQKQMDRALADLSRAIFLSPKEPVYRRYRACVLANAGQYKQAIAELTQCMSAKSSTLQSHYMRSQCYAAMHDYKAAADDLTFVLMTLQRFGFTLEEVKGYQVSYRFIDKPALLRTRAGYYDLAHQPAKALADRKAADAVVRPAEGENVDSDEDED